MENNGLERFTVSAFVQANSQLTPARHTRLQPAELNRKSPQRPRNEEVHHLDQRNATRNSSTHVCHLNQAKEALPVLLTVLTGVLRLWLFTMLLSQLPMVVKRVVSVTDLPSNVDPILINPS